eukprot:gene13882-14002_t
MVEADGSAIHTLPTTLVQLDANLSQSLVVKVTANSPVTVSGFHSSDAFLSESFLALPLEALGTHYIVPSVFVGAYGFGYIQIVTTDAQMVTDITVSTLVGTSLGPAGTYQLALAAQVAMLITTVKESPGVPFGLDELTGTQINGSAPFGVTAGHQCGEVPKSTWTQGCDGCNPLTEQLPPINFWGKAFFITSFAQINSSLNNQFDCAPDPRFHVRGDVIQVLAAHSGTRLSYNGQPFGPDNALAAGETYMFPLPVASNSSLYLTANWPVLVTQFMEGQVARGYADGDPSMTVVPPVEQWLNNYTFYSWGGFRDNLSLLNFSSYINVNYIGINPDGVLIDGFTLSSLGGQWENISVPALQALGLYAYSARLPVAKGSPHFVQHTNPRETLSVTAYAMAQYDSYSMPAGMATADLLAHPRCPLNDLPVGGPTSHNILGYNTTSCSRSSYAEGDTCAAICSIGTSGGKATCTSSPQGGIWVASDCLSDALEKNIIPQVPIFQCLAKFDGTTISDDIRLGRRRFRVTRLPNFLALQKNPTLVTFPVKALDLREALPVPNGPDGHPVPSRYDLIANVMHEGKAGQQTGGAPYRAHIHRSVEKAWYEVQDLSVIDVLPQMTGNKPQRILRTSLVSARTAKFFFPAYP